MKLIELSLFTGISAHARLLATAGSNLSRRAVGYGGASRQTSSQVWPWSSSSSSAGKEETAEDAMWSAPTAQASEEGDVVDAPPEKRDQDSEWWSSPGTDDSSPAKPSAGGSDVEGSDNRQAAGESEATPAGPDDAAAGNRTGSWNPFRILTGEDDAEAGGHQEDDGPGTNWTVADMPWNGEHSGDLPQLKWPGAASAPSTTTGTTITSTTIKPPWKIPDDHTQDRLHAECKEPKEYKRTDYAGAFGPEKIFCCHTALQVVEDIKYRCTEECTDAHPCWKSMEKKYCPMYLKAYQKEARRLCGARPTTTTTTTVTTTTTTFAEQPFANMEGPEDVHVDLGRGSGTPDPLQWCYDMCEQSVQEVHGDIPGDCDLIVDTLCKSFCEKAGQSGALHPAWYAPPLFPATAPAMSPGPAPSMSPWASPMSPHPAPGPSAIREASPGPSPFSAPSAPAASAPAPAASAPAASAPAPSPAPTIAPVAAVAPPPAAAPPPPPSGLWQRSSRTVGA